MRVLLAQLAPRRAGLAENLDRVREVLSSGRCDLAVFPELFLSGYRVGDRVHALALRRGDPSFLALAGIAQSASATVVVGAPVVLDRPGEIGNAVLIVPPGGPTAVQLKRFLPSYGPFEEAAFFTPTDRSETVTLGGRRVGFQICYDAFFPEVSRGLALAGAELLVVVSASPVTSRRLFEKVLPARAVENAVPVVYVNRVGVEDGVVFGGGTQAWDARGEPLTVVPAEGIRTAPEEAVGACEIDLDEAARWRPFRPVLRDVASRPPTPSDTSQSSGRTDGL